ncbi:membrane protein [Oikeobacillus pervagus]|uniref:Membrane protein n=1 Tax=Oikeobacillus pervagus TaxID=1325931 RepID=A0AAJ1WFU6_9BACI|nr:YihY/virulence factor BrkB family protein [Oikeobacillus pervagus]MDQ0214352.1 membrane protein [Oikeobacillus pervagus]
MKVKNLLYIVCRRFFTERFYDQSAHTAYYFLLSFLPFIIFAFSVISLFPIEANDVLSLLEPFTPESAYSMIHHTVDGILEKRQPHLISFSLLATFWLASMAIQSLVRSLNDAYQIKRASPFVLGLLNDLLLTLGFMIIVSLSLFVPIIERILQTFVIQNISVPHVLSNLWFFVKWGIGTVFLFGFFLFLYMVVPSKYVGVIEALPGAIFATLGWQIVSIGFTYYVSIGSYSKVYGQLGSMIALMVWFYLSAAVLLIGGIVNSTFVKGKREI